MKLFGTIYASSPCYSISALTLNAQWSACNTAGKAVGVRFDAGDVVALPLPGPNSRPTYVAFLTEGCTSILGKTITATIHIDAPSGTVYGVGYGAGPATFRLYFTTYASAPFNYNDSDGKHPLNYWWCYASAVVMDNADNGVDVTITAVVDPASGWSASHGENASTTQAAFNTAATNAHQVGFAFAGSQFFDTGVDSNNSTTVFRVKSLSVQ